MRIFNIDKDTLEYDFLYSPEETEILHQRLNGRTNIGIEDLRRVSLWKANRVLAVDPETLVILNKLSSEPNIEITSPFVKEVIDKLVLSKGIGFPLASAILKFINPIVFPIIDVRAYRALTGKKPNYSTYSYESYIKYAIELQKIAENKNRPLRDIDEQLYCFDKDVNGKI